MFYICKSFVSIAFSEELLELFYDLHSRPRYRSILFLNCIFGYCVEWLDLCHASFGTYAHAGHIIDKMRAHDTFLND